MNYGIYGLPGTGSIATACSRFVKSVVKRGLNVATPEPLSCVPVILYRRIALFWPSARDQITKRSKHSRILLVLRPAMFPRQAVQESLGLNNVPYDVRKTYFHKLRVLPLAQNKLESIPPPTSPASHDVSLWVPAYVTFYRHRLGPSKIVLTSSVLTYVQLLVQCVQLLFVV